MKERTRREISNPVARAAMWLSIAFMAPMSCWHFYQAASEKESYYLFPAIAYLFLSLLFFAGLTSNKAKNNF